MITETELRGKLVKLCNETSQTAVSKQFDVTKAYISDIVAGKRRISNTIAKALGYRKIGITVPVERQYEPLVQK